MSNLEVIAKLKAATERLLLEFEYLVENKYLPRWILDDYIFVSAKNLLGEIKDVQNPSS